MSRWKRIRDAFWFIPALCCAVAVLLSEAMISVDRAIDGADLGPLAGLVNRVGEAGSRDLLGAIASSTLAVAATSFSITIAVLATASSTYGPRLVRNFMADRGNQIVLGVFSATFLYSLLVLRSIRALGDTDAVFVPHLAVNLAVLLGVLSIGVLVYFINHIADSVQVWTLAGRVRSDLLDAVERLYPEGVGRDARELEDDAASAEIPGGLDADASREIGYVQQVSEDRLLAAAQRHDALVVLRVRPGGHVAEGTTLATLWPPERVDDELADEVRACVLTGSARTPEQDIAFSVQVLEEMAVRALSPGTNDPYTAINALDELSAGFARLVGRSIPSRYRYDDRGRDRRARRAGRAAGARLRRHAHVREAAPHGAAAHAAARRAGRSRQPVTGAPRASAPPGAAPPGGLRAQRAAGARSPPAPAAGRRGAGVTGCAALGMSSPLHT